MAVAWIRDEILKLIDIWGDGAIQAQLEGYKRNQDIFDKIAADFCDAGLENSVEKKSRNLNASIER